MDSHKVNADSDLLGDIFGTVQAGGSSSSARVVQVGAWAFQKLWSLLVAGSRTEFQVGSLPEALVALGPTVVKGAAARYEDVMAVLQESADVVVRVVSPGGSREKPLRTVLGMVAVPGYLLVGVANLTRSGGFGSRVPVGRRIWGGQTISHTRCPGWTDG